MAISVHCDVVSAEESIFSGVVEFAVFPGEAANSASIRTIRRSSPASGGHHPSQGAGRSDLRAGVCLGGACWRFSPT